MRSPPENEISSAQDRLNEINTRHIGKHVGRFDSYRYLVEVYDLFQSFNSRIKSKAATRALARKAGITMRADHHPLRVLIQLTAPDRDQKILSRWTRALEYANSREIVPDELEQFFKERGGIAGCARRASLSIPLRPRLNEADWDDDDC